MSSMYVRTHIHHLNCVASRILTNFDSAVFSTVSTNNVTLLDYIIHHHVLHIPCKSLFPISINITTVTIIIEIIQKTALSTKYKHD